jgi:hypothetical protein
MKRILIFMTLAAFSVPIHAAILATVPRQGSMLMPEVYYHENTDSVTVDLSAINVIAQLTPLLVSNPNDSFNPADPWFQYLDPSQQGLAFSRRYGFDMDAMSDYLPGNRALWIHKLSGSPELSFYDYNDFVSPKTWNPIFGTAGTSNAVYWNELMWHIGVTARPAPPGRTNNYSAMFEVYVVNPTTSQEVPGSSSGPFVLNWTDVPDGRPALAINRTDTNSIILTWPSSAVNWSLVSSTNLNSTNWTTVTNAVVLSGNQSAVSLDSLTVQQFFRLRRNP